MEAGCSQRGYDIPAGRTVTQEQEAARRGKGGCNRRGRSGDEVCLSRTHPGERTVDRGREEEEEARLAVRERPCPGRDCDRGRAPARPEQAKFERVGQEGVRERIPGGGCCRSADEGKDRAGRPGDHERRLNEPELRTRGRSTPTARTPSAPMVVVQLTERQPRSR